MCQHAYERMCMWVEVGLPAQRQSRSYNENRTHTLTHSQIYMRAGMRAYTQKHTHTSTYTHIHMTGHKHANMLPQLRKLHSRPAAFPKGGSTVKKKSNI